MPGKPRAIPEQLAGKQLKSWLEAEFDIQDHQRPLLDAAAAQADRRAAFASIVEAEGVITVDRFGTPRAHPAVDGERQAANAMRLLLRELGASAVDDSDEARPPRIGGRYVQEG